MNHFPYWFGRFFLLLPMNKLNNIDFFELMKPLSFHYFIQITVCADLTIFSDETAVSIYRTFIKSRNTNFPSFNAKYVLNMCAWVGGSLCCFYLVHIHMCSCARMMTSSKPYSIYIFYFSSPEQTNSVSKNSFEVGGKRRALIKVQEEKRNYWKFSS